MVLQNFLQKKNCGDTATLRHIIRTCAHSKEARKKCLQETPLNNLLLQHPENTLRYLLAAGLLQGSETDLIRPAT